MTKEKTTIGKAYDLMSLLKVLSLAVDGEDEAQQRDLAEAGCDRVFIEQVSSVDVVARTELATALDFIREGDVLVVTKLDRLARSVSHLLDIPD
jgi:DNA invertase Pin-like site-specific DNA recombinase